MGNRHFNVCGVVWIVLLAGLGIDLGVVIHRLDCRVRFLSVWPNQIRVFQMLFNLCDFGLYTLSSADNGKRHVCNISVLCARWRDPVIRLRKTQSALGWTSGRIKRGTGILRLPVVFDHAKTTHRTFA